MKKTLAVAAVLAAFAGSAMADVTVYGKVDMGIGYQNLDGESAWQLKSGGSGSSRVGFKGSEKIGDLTVGFQMEAGVTADDATGSFFSRGTHLYVKGAYGELGAGKMGALDAATGPYDLVGGVSAMGTGYFGIGGQDYVFKNRGDRLANAVAYKAPTFGGVTVTAMVASGTKDKVEEFSDEVDMYYGLGAKYAAGAFGATLVVSQAQAVKTGYEDKNVTAGVNYDFGVAKAFLAANYYEDGNKGDAHGVVASVAMPLAGGELQVNAGYGEKAFEKTDGKTMFVGGFYKYPLSKQTFLYGAAGWDRTDLDVAEKAEDLGVKDNYRAIFGMCHNF